MKQVFYVVVHRNICYYHRGLWPTKADAVRASADLNDVRIARCWVAMESKT